MLFFLNRIRKYFPPSIIYTLVLIICGAIIYGFILIILRDNFLIENARVIAKKIFRKKVKDYIINISYLISELKFM